MPLRSGREFLPYALKHVSVWKATQTSPVSTSVDAQPLVRDAVAREDHRFEEGADDSEGLGVSSRPLSPLTESDSDVDDDQPHPRVTEVPGPVEWKRKKESAKARRAQKRAKLAASRHGPHAYAASPSTAACHAKERPSTAACHAKELPPLKVSQDAESFPRSGSGSWVGMRKKGTKKEPWTVPELLEEEFTIVEWDGR